MITIKALIKLNEIKQSSKSFRQENIITSIQETITNETKKAISVLEQNEQKLKNECKAVLKEIQEYLDPNKCNDNVLFQIINESSEDIEKDEFNEVYLTNLNDKIVEIKQKLNKLAVEIKSYENKFYFNQFKI